MTDDEGNSVGSSGYEPYGDPESASCNLPEQRFTGQRLDDTGLYFYNARYYDAVIGRFISADILVAQPWNPQNFNRYSYCLNNPLKYVDPYGFDPVGHATAGNETYFIDYDENNGYRFVGADGTMKGVCEQTLFITKKPLLRTNNTSVDMCDPYGGAGVVCPFFTLSDNRVFSGHETGFA